MMLSQQLKRETLASHQRTEELLFADAIRRHTLSLEQYTRLVVTTHRVWDAVARWLDQQPDTLTIAPKDRQFVQEMLTALDADLSALPSQESVDGLNIALPTGDLPALYGVLYVLRGSTLGGKLIARALEKCPGLKPIPAFNFYRACAALPTADWMDFLSRLNDNLQDPSSREQTIRAANYLFGCYVSSTPGD